MVFDPSLIDTGRSSSQREFRLYSGVFVHSQAVATYDLRFLDIFAGWPGRSHDARVFRMNPLYRTLPGRLRHRQVNHLSETYHILGDSAFPLSPQVMTPFRNWNNLNLVERKYNRNLSSKRNVSLT